MAKSKKTLEWEEHLAWFHENMKVIDRESGKVIPLKFNRVQEHLERIKWEKMRSKEPVFLVILKARREGVSTWTESTFFRDALEFENRRAIIIAHEEKATRNILEMTKFFYDNFSSDLPTIKDSAAALKFKETKSEFMIYTAGSRGRAARSFGAHALHLSELDYFPLDMMSKDTGENAVFSAVMQVIPDCYPTVVIVESTANGPLGPMERLWRAAVEGTTEFEPVFFAWWMFDDYTRPLSWEDMAKYAPREWRDRNRSILNKFIRPKKRKGAKDGLGRGYGGWGQRKRIGCPEGHGEAEGSDGRGCRGANASERGAAESEEHSSGGQVEGEGDRPGGYLPGRTDVPGHAVFNRDFCGHDKAAEFQRALREDGSGDSDQRWRERFSGPRADPPGHDDTAGKSPRDRRVILRTSFEESLTPYERGIKEEFNVSNQQINWLRYCLYTKCEGDEIRRRREYPTRPEEAFEATGSDILDPYVIAKWEKFSRKNPPKKCSMRLKEFRPEKFVTEVEWNDPLGRIEVYEQPSAHKRYVMGVDPSMGQPDSDWQVAIVLDVDTGDQVAEFRARVDPDIAVDEIEALGHYYRAYTGVEVNSFGVAFARPLEDRGLLRLYERETFDRKGVGRQLIKRVGWNTDVSNRNKMFSEMKLAVRQDRCQIRSLITLNECRTLWEKRSGDRWIGRIEARPGCHDDGVMAYGIALMMRNRQLEIETTGEKEERKQNSFLWKLNAKQRKLDKASIKKIPVRTPTKVIHIRSVTPRPDGRRSVL